MTFSPRLSSASSTALPNACWPWTTIRICLGRGRLGLFRRRDRARRLDLADLLLRVPEDGTKNFFGVLTKQWRPSHLRNVVRHFDRIADREILAAPGVIDLDHRAGLAQGLIFREFLHRQDRTDRD